jgi:ribose transport system substrate-binding protein
MRQTKSIVFGCVAVAMVALGSVLMLSARARAAAAEREVAVAHEARARALVAEAQHAAAAAAAAATVNAQPAGEAKAGKKIKIGVSYPAADHGWTAGVGWWVKRAIALYPDVEWIHKPAADPQKQSADLEDMGVKGIDGLVILCTESAPMTPAAEKLKKKGVFIVNVDRGFTKPGVADIFLEGDNKAFGRKSAEFMAEKLGGKGNIVILTGIPCTVDTDRVTAAMEVFKRFPEIKVLGQQPAMWNREKGLSVMENFLTKHPKIDAVWAQDDDILMGAMKAIKERKRDKEMWIFGGAGMKEVVKMVMDGDPMVPADITYPPSMIAAGIHTAHSVLTSSDARKVMEFMPKHILLDVELITRENAKEYYFPDSVY